MNERGGGVGKSAWRGQGKLSRGQNIWNLTFEKDQDGVRHSGDAGREVGQTVLSGREIILHKRLETRKKSVVWYLKVSWLDWATGWGWEFGSPRLKGLRMCQLGVGLDVLDGMCDFWRGKGQEHNCSLGKHSRWHRIGGTWKEGKAKESGAHSSGRNGGEASHGT